jgi:DNA polymerase I-like protein with 3'-5' exonuclease and polymerase domains
MNSKARRVMIDSSYKSKRGKHVPEVYHEFNEAKLEVVTALRGVGAIALTQNNVEADDVIAWLAANSEEDLTVISNDNDLSALQGVNEHGATINTYIGGTLNHNKYGQFDPKHITVYKALVGDTSDTISGIKGFGDKAFLAFLTEFGDAGLAEMARMAELGRLDDIALEAEQHKLIGKIYAGRDEFLRSWQLAKMRPEWVNTISDPVEFLPGMVKGGCKDERLRSWSAQSRLVTADNYDAAMRFLRSNIGSTPHFPLDLETSTPEESDDWLAQRSKDGKGVDVIASTLTGISISFGSNNQYAYYMSVDHTDTANCSLSQVREMLEMLPKDKLSIAHNAAGFELPVLLNNVPLAPDNGWRGMVPNMVDTRIAASYWDENQFSHGLKQLSKLLLEYEQTTYDEVTGGKKMNEIPASQVLDYGCDDVYTACGLWNFFKLFMQLEHTYKAFMEYEQKPMYLQAQAYTRGIRIDMPRLSELSRADDALEAKLSNSLDSLLISKGWDGALPPVYTEVTPAVVKDAVKLLLGVELKTMVRKLDKLAEEVAKIEGGEMLAKFVALGDANAVTKLVAANFTAKPELNTGSPKQLQKLLYDTLALPVRLRNKPTDTMKKAGIREGTPRTDEDAIKMAIKFGDVEEGAVDALKALVEIKSIHTRRGLYWDAYPKLLHWKTGKLHPELRQSATNTRRFAGSNPNIQQMDSTRGGVRSVILPHKKNAIVASLDESAQEVRTVAFLSQDENLLTCYVGSKDQLRDVHSIVAAYSLGMEYSEYRKLYKEEEAKINAKEKVDTIYGAVRQKCKVVVFATLYGASAPKIAEGLGISEEEAQGYIDAIYTMFPQVLQWKTEIEAAARTLGSIRIHGGTVRHLAKLITSEDSYTASKALRQAGNASIQSTCGSQIKRVMSRIWDSRLLDDYDFHFYMTVHDEVVVSVVCEHAVPVLTTLHTFMTEPFLIGSNALTVPSESSLGVGNNFSDLIELGEKFTIEKLQEALDTLAQRT